MNFFDAFKGHHPGPREVLRLMRDNGTLLETRLTSRTGAVSPPFPHIPDHLIDAMPDTWNDLIQSDHKNVSLLMNAYANCLMMTTSWCDFHGIDINVVRSPQPDGTMKFTWDLTSDHVDPALEHCPGSFPTPFHALMWALGNCTPDLPPD